MRAQSNFARLYGGPHRTILGDSPELRFLTLCCAGHGREAADLFVDRRWDGTPPAADAPQGRYEGRDAISRYAQGFLATFGAQSGWVEPVVQTRAGGRSVTELVLHYSADGEERHVPAAAVADLREGGKMEEFRLYFYFKWVEGVNAYRAPIFQSEQLTTAGKYLLTGTVREYFEAMHAPGGVDVDRVLGAVGDTCVFGGYGLEEETLAPRAREELRPDYERMATYIPRWLSLRIETIVDDGVCCVVEWEQVIHRPGREEGHRLCESGISAYERGPDGKLCSIRICDYANCEHLIDWSRTALTREEAERRNFLDQ